MINQTLQIFHYNFCIERIECERSYASVIVGSGAKNIAK